MVDFYDFYDHLPSEPDYEAPNRGEWKAEEEALALRLAVEAEIYPGDEVSLGIEGLSDRFYRVMAVNFGLANPVVSSSLPVPVSEVAQPRQDLYLEGPLHCASYSVTGQRQHFHPKFFGREADLDEVITMEFPLMDHGIVARTDVNKVLRGSRSQISLRHLRMAWHAGKRDLIGRGPAVDGVYGMGEFDHDGRPRSGADSRRFEQDYAREVERDRRWDEAVDLSAHLRRSAWDQFVYDIEGDPRMAGFLEGPKLSEPVPVDHLLAASLSSSRLIEGPQE